MIGSGSRSSSSSSPRTRRARSMFKQIRATTVVSHASRLSRSPVLQLSRSHASWTASSASSTDPNMR